jgi:Sulfotransferase family
VVWLHVPKTGTSFFNVLLHAFCPHVPGWALLADHQNAVDFQRHEPVVQWCHSFQLDTHTHAPLTDARRPHAVTMLRDPTERILSAYFDDMHAFPIRSLVKADALASEDPFRQFVEDPRTHACQSSMLLGKLCARADAWLPSVEYVLFT